MFDVPTIDKHLWAYAGVVARALDPNTLLLPKDLKASVARGLRTRNPDYVRTGFLSSWNDIQQIEASKPIMSCVWVLNVSRSITGSHGRL